MKGSLETSGRQVGGVSNKQYDPSVSVYANSAQTTNISGKQLVVCRISPCLSSFMSTEYSSSRPPEHFIRFNRFAALRGYNGLYGELGGGFEPQTVDSPVGQRKDVSPANFCRLAIERCDY